MAKVWWGRDSEDSDLRRDAALAATAFWRETTSAPLRFVAGSLRYDNAAAFYSPERPSVFVNFDYFGNRWATPQKIAAEGLLTICRAEDSACLGETAEFATPQARRKDAVLTQTRFGRTRGPLAFVFTAIPPR